MYDLSTNSFYYCSKNIHHTNFKQSYITNELSFYIYIHNEMSKLFKLILASYIDLGNCMLCQKAP